MRGPDRGRRSPPQQRNMDRRYPAPNQRVPADRRRPRSISPPQGRGRSPGFNKRFRGPEQYEQGPRRYDEYERDFDMAYDEPRGGYPDQYARAAPSSPRQQDKPKPYKIFMMALPDEVTPEDAQRKYDEYLTAYWGSARKAHFQSIKNRPETRARFDPREQEKGVQVRNEEAQQAAKEFAELLLTGGLNPAAKDFNQGESTDTKDSAMETDGDADQPAEDANVATAPALLWKPERVAIDLKLSRQLIEKLDKEKGIVSNPLIAADKLERAPAESSKTEEAEAAAPAATTDGDQAKPDEKLQQPADAKPATPPAADGAAKMDVDIDAALPSTTKDGSPAATNYKLEVKTSEMSAAVSDSHTGDAGAHEATKEVKAEAQVEEGTSEGQEEGSVGKLDVHLTYLWRVHRVNYYVGGEWWDPCDRERWANSKRMLRAPHPEEGEQPDPDQERVDTALVKKMVDQAWQLRLSKPDPLQALLHHEEVERKIEEWIEDKVIKHSDTKWGNQLSTKMFVGKDFVLKHIRTKHAEKVEEFKQQLFEQLYWENYDTMEQNRIDLQKQARKDALQQAAEANKEPEEETPPELQHGSGYTSLAGRVNDVDEAGGMDGANGVQRSGSGAGRGVKGGRGQMRGGRGRGMGGMRGPGMGLEGAMAPMAAGMMAGMPAMPGQMLMLAPGAGPLGPFVPYAGGPMDMGGQMGGHRGQRGPGRGQRQGRGGYGGQMGGRGGYGGRGYFDLDAPENQRSVLDYGDL